MALPTTDEVCELLHDTLTGMVEGTADPVDDPPDEVRPLLDKLLEKPSTMRDRMLTLLGYVVANADSIDFRAVGKFPGGRAVAQYVADDLLPGLNIAGKKDALQTGFKGVSRYIDRENPLTKPVLEWASEQDDLEPVEQAFRYLAAGMADTARDLPPSCARNEASRAVRRSKCCWATGLSSSGERLRVLDPTATCDRAHPAELARWRSGAGRSGRLSFVHGSNRGGHGGRRTTARGGT